MCFNAGGNVVRRELTFLPSRPLHFRNLVRWIRARKSGRPKRRQESEKENRWTNTKASYEMRDSSLPERYIPNSVTPFLFSSSSSCLVLPFVLSSLGKGRDKKKGKKKFFNDVGYYLCKLRSAQMWRGRISPRNFGFMTSDYRVAASSPGTLVS